MWSILSNLPNRMELRKRHFDNKTNMYIKTIEWSSNASFLVNAEVALHLWNIGIFSVVGAGL